MGLSISKKYIEAYQGTITVNSIPEKGSTFTVNFPVATV
ncbi:MAG: HAMP domain-containing histidine kinase [Bacteroidetes bacterium]|nr:HAMP domain-containing histidine kinase [Bacteroidota bacterium]